MDFKIKNQKRPQSTIQYVRTYDVSSNEACKSSHCLSFVFQYKTSFIAMLFSIALIVCFIMMMIYVIIQSEDRFLNNSEQRTVKEEEPLSSHISLSIDPKMKDAVIALATDEGILKQDLYLTQDNFQPKRVRRQIPQNIPDCRGRQEECKIILEGVRGITKAMHHKLDRLHNTLVQRGILNPNDPKDTKFRKIVECLQCRNAINHHQDEPEDIGVGNDIDMFGRKSGYDRISDLLPFFENHVYSDDAMHVSAEDEDIDEDQDNGEERSERVPKAPPALRKQVLEIVTNSSKMQGDAKITEILHNTTIVEKEDDAEPIKTKIDSPMGTKKYTFNYRPVNVPDSGALHEESQVTRNMEASPFILPTAETTKTSQQIQFTPQSGWPSIPVCFYGPPSSSNSYQQKQGPGVPFFIPFGTPQAISHSTSNQQIKFFLPNGQQFTPTNFPPMSPQFPQPPPSPQFPQQPLSPQFPQVPLVGPGQQQQQQQFSQQSQRNLPYYCTYIPAPVNFQQQQQFPFMPNMADFERHLVGKAREWNIENSAKEADEQRKQMSESKSTYDESDEKYFVEECPGFWCNPPYRKCIANHERCDGKVDCMKAEDEIDCPYSGYYSHLRDSHLSSSSTSGQTNGATAHVAKVDEIWRQVPMTIMSEQGSANFASGQSVNTQAPVTERAPDVETTTFTVFIPDMPQHFACKRIIQTIPLEKRCDNVFDCEDTSDEEDCMCKDYLKLDYPAAICDGHVDCADGSDEEECDVCKENQYHCHRSGTCISKRKRCDQNMDCKLNEDELDCFALTDGHRLNLDLDKRPHLNLEGVLTRYDNGVWRPSCFKSEFRNDTKRMGAGQKICEYLGFKNVDAVDEIVVSTSKLIERPTSKDFPVNYEYPPHIMPTKREVNKTCYGLRIRCKPILDRKLNVHLKVDPKTKERIYTWPWEASIFVDGKYRCSAVLLENNILLASTECSEGIDLHKNYTTALLGVPTTNLPYNSPYQQLSTIVDMKPVKNSDALLFRMKNPVNMTRYVQPLYLEKRIFPASKDDTCVALGVNEHNERKMKFLQPIVDNCPKCHRCYIEKSETSSCSKSNMTTNWSGNVVCLSNGGWYPAAVFKDKDEYCGFGTKQILNSIDYIHAHLSEAIDENVQPINEPVCEGIRCSLGQCVPWDRVCNGVRECRDGADESREQCQKMRDACESNVLECKCSKAELRCGNGKCVPKEMFCDGKIDCPDGTDEPASCSCGEYLKLTEPLRVCDGRRHCLDKSDENYHDCLCKDSSFKCHKSTYNGTVACIPQDFVCDGEYDCPQGEDETESVCWAIKPAKKDPKGTGEVLKRSFGVLHSECFPRPIKTQREVTNVCTKLGYITGVLLDGSKLAEVQYVPRNDFYMFQLNNYTWVTMRDDVSFGVWTKPENNCYRLFAQCF